MPEISQGARKVVFSGTLTADGLEVRPDGERGVCASYGSTCSQEVMYVTDRAVFRLGSEAIEIVELAPGVDLEKDVLARIGFPVRVPAPPRPMDPRLFRAEPMGILAEFRRRPVSRQRRRPEP